MFSLALDLDLGCRGFQVEGSLHRSLPLHVLVPNLGLEQLSGLFVCECAFFILVELVGLELRLVNDPNSDFWVFLLALLVFKVQL